jgi:hypothetical protein
MREEMRSSIGRGVHVVIFLLGLGMVASGQVPQFAPGTSYDPGIPTLRQVLGHEAGERVTSPEGIRRYMTALHEAAPDRTRLLPYAESWEGRPLFALLLGSPERIRAIDRVRNGLQQLAGSGDVRLSSDPGPLVRELPVVVALLHGVHGNEISSGEAAMALAYHLLAAREEATVDLIRRESLVLIDPMQNPDGRARFVYQNLLGQASVPDADPLAAEHDEPWPGGRSNHYLFDLNRDWFAQTQPESEGRVRLLLDWMPHVVVDLHEMGGESTYYFPPGAPPPNPHMTPTQAAWLEKFGRATAERFDERGFAYFNREIFDAFYPGYGVSWPMAQGAIGMTFEKGSARGLVYRRRDGTLLTYLDGAIEHFTAALSTLTTAARHREQLLRDFARFRRTAGEGAYQGYLIPPVPENGDQGQVNRLVRTFLRNGIRVERLLEPGRFENRALPAGTFFIPLPQPAGALVRNLLDAQVPMAQDFLQRQEERRRNRQPDQIYDVTAWNLPMLYDLDVIPVTSLPAGRRESVRLELLSRTRQEGSSSGSDSTTPVAEPLLGYAMRWSPSAAQATLAALREGYRPRFLAERVVVDGHRFPQGIVFFRRSEHGPALHARLTKLAEEAEVELIALRSGFVTEGTSLGSNEVRTLRLPRVLLLWDAPVSSLSAGWARYVLERRYGQPATIVRVSTLARADLRQYDVIVMPSGSYVPLAAAEPLRRLRDWVQAGGTLITLAEATRWAAQEPIGLLASRPERRLEDAVNPPVPIGTTASPSLEAATRYERAIRPLQELPEMTPGSLLVVVLDREHWLTSGTDGEIQALVESNRVLTPLRLDEGRNVGLYAARERLLASGLLWGEAARQLPQRPFLLHQPLGKGQIVSFVEDPNYRAYAEATQFLFLNAVLLGPSR